MGNGQLRNSHCASRIVLAIKSGFVRPAFLAWLAIVAILLSRASAEDRIVVLGADPITAEIKAIGGDGQIELTDSAATLSLPDVRRIERPIDTKPAASEPVTVHLLGGGTLFGTEVTTGDESFTLKWAHGDELKLPLELVRGIEFAPAAPMKVAPSAAAGFKKSLSAIGGELDQLLVIDGQGGVQSLSGILEQVAASQVSFVWQDESRQIARDRVYGIIIAALGDPPDRAGRCEIALSDGSSLWAKVVRLTDGELVVEPAEDSEVRLPWGSVARLTVRSDRLVFLSDIEPLTASQQPVVTFARPYRRDLNIEGSRLSLRGKVYEKGLGVHSRSELVYANEGFDLLAATIGIDDRAGGRGDCEFVVLADGKELLRERLTGSDAPRDVQVDVSGATQITLLVEIGGDLDLADHADWCDARLIKAPAAAPAADE